MYLYVKAGKEFKVNGWQSIPHDYVIGYRKGLQYIERAAKKYEISIYPLVNLDQVLGLIIADKIDVAVGTERLFALNNKVRQKKDIVMLQPAIERHHFYSYLHKKNRNILPTINKVLISMQNSGEIELIKPKYVKQN